MPDLANSFRQLSRFYLGCVQEEGLRRLSIRSSRRGSAFIAPSFGGEKFLHNDLGRLELPRLSRPQAEFLRESAGEKGPDTTGRDRLFYGFPTRVGEEQKLSPLFFAEVQVEGSGEGWLLTRRETTPPRVNHHLFWKEGYYPEQIAGIQDRIEDHSGPFSEKLEMVLGHLSGTPEPGNWRETCPLPGDPSPSLQVSPILFESTYSSYTYNLERDLSALQKYNFLQEAAGETALAPFFEGSLGEGSFGESSPGARREGAGPPTEVLRLNGEQGEAVRAACEEPLSAVTGPPGTGKSQVVVNLLAGAALSGEAVLFASKNNKAVDVVRERMREIMGEEFDFLLRLGSRRQMEEMEEELTERFRALAERREELTSRFSEERARRLRKEVEAIRGQVAELRRRREAHREAVAERREAEEELPDSWAEPAPPAPTALPLGPLRSALDRARALAGETQMGVFLWLRRLLMGSRLLERLREEADRLAGSLPQAVQEAVYARAYGAEGFEGLAQTLGHLTAYRRWMELRAEEREAEEKLEEALGEASSFEGRLSELKGRLTGAHKNLLQAVWVGRVARNLPETRNDLRSYFEAVRRVRNADPSGYREALSRLESAIGALSETLPVWIVTNLSARNALPLRPGLFDLVVIDEASQCDLASAMPLLYRAERSVIIGDPKQLRHITSIDEEQERRIARRSGATDLGPRWSYVHQSLYDLAEQALREGGEKPTFLKSHYRSHPKIIGFSNRRFYGGRLRPERPAESFSVPEKWRGVRWIDVEGEVPEGIRSAYNDREIQTVLQLLGRWFEEGILPDPALSTGVVTPFRVQADRLQERMREAHWWERLTDGNSDGEEGPTVGTAHRFQGDERDLMIFSPVVAPGINEFTQRWVATTDQLLNVAVTRARASLQVVGHLSRCRQAGGDLEAFADYVAGRTAPG